MTTNRTDLSLFLLRLFATPIFAGAGLHHLLSPDKIAQRLAAAPHAELALAIAPARTLVLLAGVALLAGGAALLAGLFTRTAALGLLAVLVPITLTVQVGGADSGPLLKNVALAGILLHLALGGGGRWAADALLERRRRAAQGAGAQSPRARPSLQP